MAAAAAGEGAAGCPVAAVVGYAWTKATAGRGGGGATDAGAGVGLGALGAGAGADVDGNTTGAADHARSAP
eukprot:1105333-Rhodomonas_salina.2